MLDDHDAHLVRHVQQLLIMWMVGNAVNVAMHLLYCLQVFLGQDHIQCSTGADPENNKGWCPKEIRA